MERMLCLAQCQACSQGSRCEPIKLAGVRRTESSEPSEFLEGPQEPCQEPSAGPAHRSLRSPRVPAARWSVDDWLPPKWLRGPNTKAPGRTQC
jgi:hypothetical protein